MPEETGNIDAKDYGLNTPQTNDLFELKGANHYDWGMKDRLSRVFNPKSGRTVMLAFDHGYIMGPTSGLERIDLTIRPLLEHADCLMCARGILRTVVPATTNKAISLRCSAGSTILTELNDECVGVEIEDAIRLNASLMAVWSSALWPKATPTTVSLRALATRAASPRRALPHRSTKSP